MLKKLLVLLVVMVSVASVGQAQLRSNLVSGKAFANDSSHTYTLSAIGGFNPGIFERLSLYSSFTDTVSVKVYVDQRTYGNSSWTVKDSSTITVTSATTHYNEWVLRDNTTEKVPGLNQQYRFRFVFQSSANGVSGTRTYSATAIGVR